MSQARRSRVTCLPDPAVSALHNWTDERELLDSMWSKRPRDIRVILGPRSCGKTAVLKSYDANNNNVAYVDCRAFHAASPTAFTSMVLQKLLPLLPSTTPAQILNRARKLLSGVQVTLGTSSEVTFGQAATSTPKLDDLLKVLGELLVSWKKAMSEEEASRAGVPKWPVLVIDEANVLKEWDENPKELASLLRFFVMMTKQDAHCHVLMATSEYGFQTWLNSSIGPGFWTAEVIGDFPEADARQFLEKELAEMGSGVLVDNSAWDKVYQVCGGNAGVLGRLAFQVSMKYALGDWDEALELICMAELERIRSLALGREGYTAPQYADAALQLLDAKPHHAVAQTVMQLRLGRYAVGPSANKVEASKAGKSAFERMLQVHALSMRPPSVWAHDIPKEAFLLGGRRVTVVTAPSAVDLYCMGILREELAKVLEVWEQEQQTLPVSSLLSSPEVQAQAVKDKFQGIGDQIKGLDEEIKAANDQADATEGLIGWLKRARRAIWG